MFDRTASDLRSVPIAASIICLLAASHPAFGAPVITGVSGVVDQRSVVTITGSGFGTGPSGVVFDDFEGGTVGNSIMTGPGSALLGQWDSTAHSNYYTDDHSVSGFLAFEADMSVHYLSYIRRTFPAGTSEVFACWWVRVPSGNMPGEQSEYGINWKHIWVQGQDSRDDDVYLVWGDTLKMGGNCGVDDIWTGWNLGDEYAKGDWVRQEFYLKGGLTDGHADWYLLHEDGAPKTDHHLDGKTWGNHDGDSVGLPREYRDIRFNAYGRSTTNCYPIHDDCYSAYGPNCRARVEIGNNPTYANCTALAICVPTSWSDTSITAKCNIGGLDSADDWYLFAVDAANSISPGHLVASMHTLTVTNGTGSGDYDEGEVVPISANAPPSGKAFAVWVGDFAHVADRLQASTTVTMPAADISVTAAYVNVYTLTVNSGTGDGQYTSGTIINIDADPAVTGKQFDQWTGDTLGIADTESASTTITMSGSDADITATYTDIPPAYWPGDVNQDFFVGGTDLDYVLADWGHSGGEIIFPAADINSDNFVGGTDLDYVLADWGKTGSPP